MNIKRVETLDEQNNAYKIRNEVFVKEQGVPSEIERDEYDEKSIHVIALLDNQVIGCGRIYIYDNEAKIGRIAVLINHRKAGVGKEICDKLIQIALQSQVKQIILNSQITVVDFYKKFGFVQVGDIFLDADMEHIRMVKIISN